MDLKGQAAVAREVQTGHSKKGVFGVIRVALRRDHTCKGPRARETGSGDWEGHRI